MKPLLLLWLADDRDIFELKVCVSRWLATDHPEAIAELRDTTLPFRLVRRRDVIEGRTPNLRGFDAVVTASESSHPAHAGGHALALRARAAGVRTYTLQHGLENVGLGMGEAGEIASDVVFCWLTPAMAADAPEAVRKKLVYVGRPRTAPNQPAAVRYVVGVFENLHAERYSDADRMAFLDGFAALAGTGAPILLRPHPAGRWSRGLDLARWPNVSLGTSGSGPAAVASAERIVTTPSTVVLDAAQAGRPVALACEGGELYRSFPVLRGPEDWLVFAAAPDTQAEQRAAFLARTLVPGDATGEILKFIHEDLKQMLAPK